MDTSGDCGFFLRELNLLPRPPLTPDDANGLAAAFPFLFKPNRALALYRNVQEPGAKPLPFLDPDRDAARWLLRLSPRDEPGFPPCVAVVGKDGCLTLWRYAGAAKDAGADIGGLLPVPLAVEPGEADALALPCNSNRLYLDPGATGQPYGGGSRALRMVRFSQQWDEDGQLYLRIETDELVHRVEMDFSGFPDKPVPCFLSVQPQEPGLEGVYQIGGWGGGRACHRRTSDGELYEGSVRRKEVMEAPGIAPRIRLRAAAERHGWRVLGGESGRLFIFRRPRGAKRFAPYPDAVPDSVTPPNHLQAHIRALTLLYGPAGEEAPFLAAGGDDHFLYLFDMHGALLNKVNLGGQVDAIIVLRDREAWADLALLVHGRGLACGRLFYDRLHVSSRIEPERAPFLARLEALLARREASLLPRWLGDAGTTCPLLAAAAIVHRPTSARVELLSPEGDLLERIGEQVTAYFAHALHRALRRQPEVDQALDPETLLLRFQLLLHLAHGPYHARIAVHRLEGWLVNLRPKGLPSAAEARLRRMQAELSEVLSDAKRELRRCAKALAGNHLDEACLIDLSARLTRIEHDRLFNELIVPREAGLGRVEAVALADFGRGRCALIFAPRGSDRLHAFFTDAQDERVAPKLDGERLWAHQLYQRERAPVSPHGLLPLNETAILVVAERSLGVAVRGEQDVYWYPDHEGSLRQWNQLPVQWGAAVRRDDVTGRPLQVAVAVESPDRATGPVVRLFAVHDDGRGPRLKLVEDGRLRPPPSHRLEHGLRAVAWDPWGGLWGVTVAQGLVIHWEQAAQAAPNAPVTGRVIATAGCPQYTVAALAGRVVCGGKDGAVRAFHHEGGLAWVFLTPGPVRAITLLPGGDGAQAPRLAVITEAEHLFILDGEGRQQGMLFWPGRHPVALASGLLQEGGQVHHLVGMLEGEVRLVEAVPPATDLTHHLLNADQKRLATDMDAALEALRQSDAPQRWCTVDEAGQEPLQVAWAADALLGAGLAAGSNAEPVLSLLEGIEGRHDGMSGTTRALVFFMLARVVERLPAGQWSRFVKLFRSARDGSPAAFMTAVSMRSTIAGPDGRDRLHRLFHRALSKASRGLPYVASALLRILRDLPPEYRDKLDLSIGRLLDRPPAEGRRGRRALHEGLLALALWALEFSPGGLLAALSRLPAALPRLSRRLCRQPAAEARLLDWLDTHGETVLPAGDWSFWQTLGPLLRNPETLEQEEAWTGPGSAAETPDTRALRALLTLFPESADPPDDPELLPGPWQEPAQLTRALYALREEATHLPAAQLKERLDLLQRRLGAQPAEPRPLFSALYRRWGRLWEHELLKLQRHLPQRRVDYPDLIIDPVRVVAGEPAPLTLRLHNRGPEDLTGQVTLALHGDLLDRLHPGRPTQAQKLWLRVDRPGLEPDALELRTVLLPPFPPRLALEASWSVHGEQKSVTREVELVERWTDYRRNFPHRDALAYRLFAAVDDERPRHRRIVVKRWRRRSLVLSRGELTSMVREWAERAGRLGELRLLSPETGWPKAVRLDPERWETALAEPPEGLEVWLVEDAIAWSLKFLEAVDRAAATALFLPDLAPEDRPSPALRDTLDELLALKDANRFAPLQWALKACTQGVSRIEKGTALTLPPTLLGRTVRHGSRQLPRGALPDAATWRDPQTGFWPIAGVTGPRDLEALPPDPARPLAALVEERHFRFLRAMGLVTRFSRWWVPKAASLLEYADEIYPTRTTGSGPEEGSRRWGWEGCDWSGSGLWKQPQAALFATRRGHPEFPPYEGLGPGEWTALREIVIATKAAPRETVVAGGFPKGFQELLGLPDQEAFERASKLQGRWLRLLAGQRSELIPLLQRLIADRVRVEKLDELPREGSREPLFYARLRLLDQRGRFERMVLVLPTEGVDAQIGNAAGVLPSELARDALACQPPEWRAAIPVVVWPEEAQPGGSQAERDVVLLNARALNRLMVCEHPTRALLEIAQTQIPLSNLGQSVFKTAGPVDPSRFFGRVAPLKRLKEGLLAGKSYVVSGPRSIGKSSLLHYLPHSAPWREQLAERFFCVSLDLQEQRAGLDDGKFLGHLLHALRDQPLATELIDEIGRLRAVLEGALEKCSADAVRLTERLLLALETAVHPLTPLYLVDEADGFYKHDLARGEPLFTLFRAHHNNGRAQFIFASYPARADSLARHVRNAANQAYNFLEEEVLTPLAPAEGARLVRDGMAEVGVRLDETQARLLACDSFLVPNVVQWACMSMLRLLERQLQRGEGAHVGQGLLEEAVRDAHRWYLDTFFSQLNDAELRLALVGLVLDGHRQFVLQEAVAAFVRHAGVELSLREARERLEGLLHTLMLESLDGIARYRFAGPEERPYFPTLMKSVLGYEGAEEMMLHQMDNLT